MPKMDKATCVDLFGTDAEPTITAYIHKTLVIKDGRGGVCRVDVSETNDLIGELASQLPNDASKVQVIDLTNITGK